MTPQIPRHVLFCKLIPSIPAMSERRHARVLQECTSGGAQPCWTCSRWRFLLSPCSLYPRDALTLTSESTVESLAHRFGEPLGYFCSCVFSSFPAESCRSFAVGNVCPHSWGTFAKFCQTWMWVHRRSKCWAQPGYKSHETSPELTIWLKKSPTPSSSSSASIVICRTWHVRTHVTNGSLFWGSDCRNNWATFWRTLTFRVQTSCCRAANWTPSGRHSSAICDANSSAQSRPFL